MNNREAIAQLEQLKKDAKAAQRRGELRAVNIMAEQAISSAPGSRKGEISVQQTEEETILNGGDEFSAYVEFGTGDFAKAYVATLPVEFQDEARKFFVNGKGHGSPAPFFFPSIQRNVDKVYIFVDEELQKLAK